MHQRFRPLLCPECNYDQRGLDPIHNCPECGFEFDPNIAIYRAVPERIHIVPILLGLALALGGGIIPALLQPGSNFARATQLWTAVVIGGLICLGAWDGLLGYRWRYAVITLDELHLARGDKRIRVPWSHVRGVTLWPTVVVTVRLRRPGRTIRVRGVFDSWNQARQFANLARRRMCECAE